MQIAKSDLEQIISLVVENTIKVLEDKKLLNKQSANEKTAYQKTEQLLYNYRGFQRIVRERQQEIEELRKYGVPQKSSGAMGGERVQSSRNVQGIVLPEEAVEAAVHNVEASVQGTVQAIALIDKCLYALRNDPYYKVLEMRYFDGLTQEDIALEFKCAQSTISQNRNRLVRELSIRLFPDQSMSEMMN